MIKLLNDKLELVKIIEELTKHITKISLVDEFDKYNELLDKRQGLINEIDIIDKSIKKSHLQSSEAINVIENEIKTILRNIIDMDKIIKLNTEKEIAFTKNKLDEIDKRLQTSDYIVDDAYKKSKGYFLDTKS